ncbi:hypothetical protein [Aliikangiella sp. IMCC44359]|uniref:hypothetical protein n=1 Tax=Aliikangiella sp. IMCC44359 TaxID=3459125 RepID=UPI00403AA8B8
MLRKNTITLVAPINSETIIISPNRCVLKVGNNNLDIGSICYLERTENTKGVKVNGSSLSKKRFNSARLLAKYFSELMDSGLRVESIYTRFKNLTKFLIWCDKNKLHDVLTSFRSTRVALVGYIGHLKELIKTQKLKNNTATRYQLDAIIVLRDCFNFEKIDRGLNLLKKSNREIENTEPPDDKDQGRVLALSTALFMGFQKATLNNEKYPYLIPLPKGTGFDNDQAWIFPTSLYALHPKRKPTFHAYNYREGRINTVDEIEKHYVSKTRAKIAIQDAKNALKNGEVVGSYHRLAHATIAMNAFLLLFIANTGMGWSELTKLPWRDTYEVGVDVQGFREIKYRAFDKEVSFIVTSSFLPLFKSYLELREYIVSYFENTTLLFFTLSLTSTKRKLSKLGRTKIPQICRGFRIFEPTIPIITAKEWRAAKSDYLVRSSDIQTAAFLLQNDERTVRDHYTKGSKTKAIAEVSDFLERIVSKVKGNSAEETESALGSCDNPGEPSSEQNPPIVPDCRKGEGCLFCKHYGVHADEKDIRKLFSCKLCIESASHLSGTFEDYLIMFGAVLNRIDALLELFEKLSQGHKELVERIKSEVFEDGELDSYWELKYEQLLNLGVI